MAISEHKAFFKRSELPTPVASGEPVAHCAMGNAPHAGKLLAACSSLVIFSRNCGPSLEAPYGTLSLPSLRKRAGCRLFVRWLPSLPPRRLRGDHRLAADQDPEITVHRSG